MILKRRKAPESRLVVNEKAFQNALYLDLQTKHPIIVPNVHLHFWEADLIGITGSDFVHEYEIKLSKSDFRADFNKKTKHNHLKGRRGPNYFWYVCPPGLLTVEDMPEYAGLIQIVPNKLNRSHRISYGECERAATSIEVIKQAPRLHDGKITLKGKHFLARGLMLRYWSQRCKAA